MNKLFKGMLCTVALVGFTGLAQAKKYEIEVTDGGSISGKVLAGSAVEKSKIFTISKDTQICGEGNRTVPFVIIENGTVKNAVVFLYKVKQGKAFPKELMNVTLNQKKCEFTPAFSVIANGGNLTAMNSDETLHNIHTYELIGRARRTAINVSQPNAGDKVTKKIKMRKGAGMKIECDAHDFMHAYMFVASNPYYAVVGENGEFTIDNVPPGEYKIRLWQGFLGEIKSGKVKVTAGADTKIDLSF